MPIGSATETPRTSFRGQSPRLAAAQPPNQACGVYPYELPGPVEMALDSIQATELESEVVHLVCRVNSPRSALRVVAEFRAARLEQGRCY
jgi:hypothetical protein